MGLDANRGETEDGTAVRDERSSRRRDARRNRQRILDAASEELRRDPEVSVEHVAAVAGVGRSTLYRHFPTRAELLAAAEQHAAIEPGRPEDPSDETYRQGDGLVIHAPPGPADLEQPAAGELRPAGSLGAEKPLVVDATHVLNEVPPHLVGEQLVTEAQRLAGVPVALYVIDIDGTHLLRLAGSGEFPSALRGPLSVGPEIAPDAMAQLYAQLQDVLPDSFPFPLWLRGRAIGVLLAVRRPKESLTEIARQGTAALEVAALYTDVFDVARRRRTTSAAAEVQLNLLPPRHAPIAGGEIAGSLIPGYDVAGDWFDYVENRDGTWLAIADPRGSGPTSAAFGALVHGALRAARRSGANLESAVAAMDELTREIGVPDFTVSCVVARWHADVSVLGWINCGHPPPLLWTADDSWKELSSPENPVLGEGAGHAFRVQQRVLSPGERVILYTNGVLRRRTSTGGQFGVEGIERAVRQMGNRSAAATTRAIQTAVGEASEDPIEDDTGVVVLRVT